MSETSKPPDDNHLTSTIAAIDQYSRLSMRMVMLFGVVQSDGALICECPRGSKCESPGKHPRRRGWRKAASSNAYLMRQVFKGSPNSNLAIATGELVVLDFDPRHGSDDSERHFVETYGTWPETAEVQTGGGGRHLYFRADGWRVGNSLPVLDGFPGIDVRGRGGYVAAPPSRHVSGSVYEWTTNIDRRIPELPSALTEGLVADLQALPAPQGVTPYVWAAVAGEYEKTATAKRGTRNQQLFVSSCALGELVGKGGLDEDIFWHYLEEAASLCGLSWTEAEPTIRSGLKRGSQNPRPSKSPFNNREEAMEYLTELRVVAHSLKWSGHSGKRQITVLEALIRIAMRTGGPSNFAKGVRGIKQEAGYSSSETVMTALKELQHRGWVQLLFKGDSIQRPSRWRLQIPQTALQDLNESTPTLDGGVVQVLQHPQLPIGHDLFRGPVRGKYITNWHRYSYHYGIGKNGWRILELLMIGAQPSRRAIATEMGVSPATVGRHVRKLIEGDLVAETEHGIVATIQNVEDLDRLAREYGTYGAAVRQRESLGWDPGFRTQTGEDGGVAPPPELDPCPHRPRCPDGYLGCDPEPDKSSQQQATASKNDTP